MSALLKDRVWVMLSGVAKRGIFPLHASKMGVFRIPTEITERSDISSISNDLKNSGFKIDTYADRIYITYKWNESSLDPTTQKDLTAELYVTVEVVTGEESYLYSCLWTLFSTRISSSSNPCFYYLNGSSRSCTCSSSCWWPLPHN